MLLRGFGLSEAFVKDVDIVFLVDGDGGDDEGGGVCVFIVVVGGYVGLGEGFNRRLL